jgi:hypothetical protein
MGMFGGTVDEQQRTIYIDHFYACHRCAPDPILKSSE